MWVRVLSRVCMYFPDNPFLAPKKSVAGELTTFGASNVCAPMRQNAWTETEQRGAHHFNATNSASFDPP